MRYHVSYDSTRGYAKIYIKTKTEFGILSATKTVKQFWRRLKILEQKGYTFNIYSK